MIFAALLADGVASESVLIRLIESSPIAVALLLVGYYFIRYIQTRDLAAQTRESAFLDYVRARDKSEQEAKSEYAEKLTTLGDNCHAFQKELAAEYRSTTIKMTDALDRNTVAFGKNSEALNRVMVEMDRRDGEHNNHTKPKR